ncbi:MAG: large repetitive protein, partial [Gaiellaceae bacterium]|nr:large repetitive protein [Gaiellaceae bacterium]
MSGSYAAVADANPYGLVALRSRGIKYWWAGIGLLVFAVAYVAPVVAAYRQPAAPPKTTPLPALSLPDIAVPLLRVPKLHALPGLPPVQHAAAQQRRAVPTQIPAARTAVRRRVPVVSDTHAQIAPAPKTSSAAPADPFANAPVVSDDIGNPVALPASAAAPAPPVATTDPATPAPTTDPAIPAPASDAANTDPSTAAPAGATAAPASEPSVPNDSAPPTQTAATETDRGYVASASSSPIGTLARSSTIVKPAKAPLQLHTVVIGKGDVGTVTAISTPVVTRSLATIGTSGATHVTAPATYSVLALQTEPAAGTTTGASDVTSTPGSDPNAQNAGSAAPSGSGGSSGGTSGTTGTTDSGAQNDAAVSTPPVTPPPVTPDPNQNTTSGVSPPAPADSQTTAATAGTSVQPTSPPESQTSATVTTSVSAPTPSGTQITAAAGGTASSTDGLATVSFGAGAVTSDVWVTVTPASSSLGAAYDLKAVTAAGAEVDTFSSAPTLTIHYTGAAPGSIYYLDPSGPVAISSTVDAAAQTISAALPHFSSYVAGQNLDVTLTPSPAAVATGATSALGVHVSEHSDGSTADGAVVTFTITGGPGTLSSSSCTITSFVCGTPVTITSSDPGVAQITATVSGATGANTATSSVTFTGAWNVTLAGGTSHTVAISSSSSNLSVAIDGGAAKIAPVSTVTSHTVDGHLATHTRFTVTAIAPAISGGITLIGSAGNDSLTLASGVGAVAVTTNGGNDSLDLTGQSGVTHSSAGSFTDAAGDALTVTGAFATLDLRFDSSAAPALKSAVTSALNTLQSVVNEVDATSSALSDLLPLLQATAGASADRLTHLVSAFHDLSQAASGAGSTLQTLSTSLGFKLSQLVTALNGVITGLAATNPLRGLTFSSSYGTAPTGVLVFLNATLNDSGCFAPSGPYPQGCLANVDIPLDLGPAISGLGISLDADPATPGDQVPSFTVGAS